MTWMRVTGGSKMTYGRKLPISGALENISISTEINMEAIPRLVPISTELKILGPKIGDPRSKVRETLVLEKSLLTHPDAVKAVYSFKLSLSKEFLNEWNYEPGDAFDCFCKNSPEIVEELLNILELDGSTLVDSCQLVNGASVTIMQLFFEFLDFSQFPKKAFLRHLAEFCESELDKKCLLFLSSRPGSSHYLELAKQYAGLLDFLTTFPSCRPTIGCLLAHLPPLSPRSYSVMSSRASSSPTQIEFIASIDWYKTPNPDERLRFGICSNYLERHVQIGDSLKIIPRPSPGFRLSEDVSRPIILICAGVAISPFIGFLRHRKAMNQMGLCWLFFGFRSKNRDFLFSDELAGHLSNKYLTDLLIATSRDEPLQYIQDVMWERKDELYRLISQPDSLIYLCGDEMTMIKAVNDCLIRILTEHLGADSAASLHKQWIEARKILKDIWV